MNTATTTTATTTTITLNEGFFSRRNWFDWLFAAIVAVGASVGVGVAVGRAISVRVN